MAYRLRVVFTIKKVTPTLNVAIQSGLTYEPGVKVQDRFQTTTAVNDKGANVEGTFSCTDELQAYNGTAHSYTVTFTPTNTNWYNTATCEAVATVARAPQEIVWTMEDDTECVTGTVLGAYATSGLAVAYTVSDPSVATVDNTTGELIVSTINQEIDVTVCQDGDLNWLPAECITKTLQTVGARPDDLSDVTATDITYEQTLNSSQLSGVVRLGSQEIEGTRTKADRIPTRVAKTRTRADRIR